MPRIRIPFFEPIGSGEHESPIFNERCGGDIRKDLVVFGRSGFLYGINPLSKQAVKKKAIPLHLCEPIPTNGWLTIEESGGSGKAKIMERITSVCHS